MPDRHVNDATGPVAPESPSRRRFLRKTAAALAAAPFVRPPAASGQPAVRPAPGMPAPHFVPTNGIRMAVYERGEGLPVVFVHGFPELAYSWRNQIRSYPAAGLRAIAPDMRGYGLTDRPAEVDGYAIPSLCADLAGLLDALNIERALTGFTGGFNYYRANIGRGGAPRPAGDIDVPCLYVGAENDTIEGFDRSPCRPSDVRIHYRHNPRSLPCNSHARSPRPSCSSSPPPSRPGRRRRPSTTPLRSRSGRAT